MMRIKGLECGTSHLGIVFAPWGSPLYWNAQPQHFGKQIGHYAAKVLASHSRAPKTTVLVHMPYKFGSWFIRSEHAEVSRIHGSYSSMVDWDADLSPCNFAASHVPAERSSFISL